MLEKDQTNTTGTSERTDYISDMARERLENSWRSYQQPKGTGDSRHLANSTQDSLVKQIEGEEIVPMAEGTLTDNLGVPIVIVISKVSPYVLVDV